MFYVGAVLIVNGRYTFSKMLIVFALIMFSVTFSSSILQYLPQMIKSTRAAVDLLRVVKLSTDTREDEGRMTFPIAGRLEFDDVHFAYPQRAHIPVLEGTTFDVKPGECVGVVGASGCGKSTVASLLQRLYSPSSGSVRLDGRPLTRVDVHYLRDHIGVVSQHAALFDMTISDNIAYGDKLATEEDIVRAAKAAHVHNFILSLPKGYDTMLGENASLISGGQAQRLQIARALLRSREILILDEATSALDPVNQQLVMDTIMEAKRGKTTLVITHKLNVMQMCDRLLVLGHDGQIAESGTYAELRARDGAFSKLAGEWA